MSRSFKSLPVLVLVVALGFSPLASSARIHATSFIPVQTTIEDLNDSQVEDVLVSEIHRIADEVFAEIKKKDPKAKITKLKKVERAVIQKLKDTGKIVEMVRSLNPKMAIPVVATEILINAGLAPLLIAKGHVVAGTIAFNFPSAPLALSLFLAFESQKIRWKIARELKISAIDLDKIRKDVLGYNLKNRITSLILQDGEIRRELELVKNYVEVGAGLPGVVTVAELEQAISSTENGRSFLIHAFAERGNSDVYSVLLIQYLNQSPDSFAKIMEIVNQPLESRRSTLVGIRQQVSELLGLKKASHNAFPELRNHLLEVRDVQNHIDREIRMARTEIWEVKRKVKNEDLTKAQAHEIRKYLKSEIERLNEMKVQSLRHQYLVLMNVESAYHNSDQIEVARVVEEYRQDLNELKSRGSFDRQQIERPRPTYDPEFLKNPQYSRPGGSCQKLFSVIN